MGVIIFPIKIHDPLSSSLKCTIFLINLTLLFSRLPLSCHGVCPIVQTHLQPALWSRKKGTESPLTPPKFPYSPYFLGLETHAQDSCTNGIEQSQAWAGLYLYGISGWYSGMRLHPRLTWKIWQICQPQGRFRGHPWQFNIILLLPCVPPMRNGILAFGVLYFILLEIFHWFRSRSGSKVDI